MIHDQEPFAPSAVPRVYAYCRCGVCAPLRRRWSDALADDLQHIAVCSARKAT